MLCRRNKIKERNAVMQNQSSKAKTQEEEMKCKTLSRNKKQSCPPFGKAKCQKYGLRKWKKELTLSGVSTEMV